MEHWIRTPPALAALAEELRGCRSIALDSESDSLYHHVEKVCLVQVATDRGRSYLVDTLELRDLSPLAQALADPAVTKVLHGADYDVTTLKRDFGLGFSSLVDTMLAARLLGRAEVGLAAVVRDELGIQLSKHNQKDDWSRRPLTAQQEAYALADVAHLVELRQRLEAKLDALGRLAWLREECDAVAALPAARRRESEDAYLSIKGARRLVPRGLAALRELHAWRERRAAETDIPAFKILDNHVLLHLAEARPRDLAGFAGLPARQAVRDGIQEALRRAEALPQEQLPVPTRTPRPVVSEAVATRVKRLKAWRAEKASALALDVSVVLPQRLIDRVAEAAPSDRAGLFAIEGLRRWRIEAFGEELLAKV